MNVVGLCCLDWVRPTRAIIKGEPYCSPPLEAQDEGLLKVLHEASEADVFYLGLHGYEDKPNYSGQSDEAHGPMVLTPDLVAQFDWAGVVILANVCYGAYSRPENNKIPNAFLARGAKAFIGSKGTAYGRLRPTLFDGEADQLCKQFLRFYKKERDLEVAYALALGRFALLSFPLDADDRATLKDFVILTKEK